MRIYFVLSLLCILHEYYCFDFLIQSIERPSSFHPRAAVIKPLERESSRQSILLSNELDAFKTTDSGLKYIDLVRGEGKSAEAGQTVRVNYAGWLDDFESEKKFDSSYDRRTPLTFKVGTRQVIAGWDEALLTDMPVGTKRKVIIPSGLGYGKRGAGGVIPPNSDLYFLMELVGIGVR